MTDLRKSLSISAPIAEITGDLTSVVFLNAVDIAEMTDGDESPQFAIVAIEEGTSKNKLTYGPEILQSIADQINEMQPVGYLGHVHREKEHKDNLLPEPQTVWAGANVQTGENGKKQLFIKGYNLPKAKVRDWIKRKAVNSVSWAGDAVLTPDKNGGYIVKEFMLESIDWSRKNVQGMNAKLIAVVSEMESELDIEGDERIVTQEEIARLQLAELEEHNPALVALIRAHAAKDSRDLAIAEMEKKIEETPAAEEVNQVAELRTKFGIAEDKSVIDAVTEMYEKLEEAAREEVKTWFNELLAEKIPNEKPRKLVGRLVGVQEMTGDFINDKEAVKKRLADRLTDALENDEEIKTAVAEMGASRGGAFLKTGEGEEILSSNLKEEWSAL